MRQFAKVAFVLVACTSAARAEMATRGLKPLAESPPNTFRFDIRANAKVYRADLLISRAAEAAGRDDGALASVEIVPVFGAQEQGKPLELRAPWYDRLDATETVRAWASGKPNSGFLVKACPPYDPKTVWLELTVEGREAGEAPAAPWQVKAVRTFHHAGQTFIVFDEIDERSASAAPTWTELKARIERMDAETSVHYRVFRHTAPIRPESLHEAEWLGDVKPMSAYNVLGRSVDQLIAQHRRRAIDNLDFSKQLARQDYFSKYNPEMPEMGEVPVARFAIEDGKPLPPKTGLYVHHPQRAEKAYYAVISVVDGVASSDGVACAGPIAESVGLGEPVLQGKPEVTVFFDYPGERRQYVQWAAPPLSHLPNQYYNWGVFVPRGYEKAKVRRLSIFFHDATQRFLKPPWPHRQDTVLLSPHDAPYRSFGYGYHEALGTLRSFRQGKVQPFFARRVDAMLDFSVAAFGADPARVSCGGSGYWGGTAALQYGLRRPGRIAYVMSEQSADANPQETPYEFSFYGRGDKQKTRRPEMDAVWGKAEWKIEAESGKPVWEEMNLVAFVLANGNKITLPFLSLGAGSLHQTWKQETGLLKSYLATHNAFMAEFFWGSSQHLHLPISAEEGEQPFEPRSDRPLLACNPKDRSPNPRFFEQQFETGQRGYADGGRLATRPRWDSEDVVDEADRLELTICCARRVVYAGHVTCDVAVRNTRKFRPKPGERLSWTAPDPKDKRKQLHGEATVDENGHILIQALEFNEPGRLVIRRAEAKE